ncbi:S41 family peptidase [bacterium]|nr:S41 family peptidase [bacterium]
MSTKKQALAVLFFISILVLASGRFAGWVSANSPDFYYQIQKNIELFGRVYQEISSKYVEEVDPHEFMRSGIEGMLSKLDPYTVLVEKEDNAELQIMSSGKYGGLGMRIGLRGKWPTVVDPPFDGTPALRAGIREGDRILEIDGSSTKGTTISHVASLLRGEIGSEVFLKVAREGESGPIDFRLIRAEIVVTDVSYSGILEDGIGYIRLTHFSRNAGKDIEKAIRGMKKEGLQALILDLRSNPGGLLEAAVNVSENFIEKGKVIVSTKGRGSESEQKYRSQKTPILEEMPLVILVNGFSASASEIVAGAVQDLDRGVIIGTNTFGKGLVQTVVQLTGEAALKITTAKYLLPSGRSIQDPNKFLKDREQILIAIQDTKDGRSVRDDSESDSASEGEMYLTANGRKVRASHGVTPDIIIEPEQLSQFEIELLRKTMPFQFSVIYAAKHPELERGFEVTAAMVDEFGDFLREKQFEYTSEAQAAAERLEEIAKQKDYFASVSTSLDELKEVLSQRKVIEFKQSEDFIKGQLEQEISAKLWGTRAEVEAGIDSDETVQRAVAILRNSEEYKAILSGRGKKE